MTQDMDQLLNDNKSNAKKVNNSSTSKSSTSSPNSSNSNRSERRDKSRDGLQTRVVIRHLPPTMTEQQFLEEVSPIPEYNDYYLVRADPSLGLYSFCRAYINFIHMEDVFIFKDKFDNYVFVDSKGNEYSAIVEFAPFQKIPRRRIGANGQPITAKKRDNKCGTIVEDSDYVEFLESLEKVKTESNLPSAEIFLEEIEAREKELKANHGVPKVVTPLIEFIKNRKAEKMRLREERREERRTQQLEQKRLREEEHQRKVKLQLKKQEESKKVKDSDEKEKSSKKDDDKDRHRYRDKDKSEESKRNESKRFDSKKSEKRSSFSSRFKSDKPKDSSESTFVVKVLQNPDKDKAYESSAKDVDNTESNVEVSNKSEFSEQKKSGENSRSEKKDGSVKEKMDMSSKSDSKSRIRNKDRPTREIYKPGATKRGSGSSQSDAHTSGGHKSGTSSRSEHGYKNRVFTRSKHTD